MPVVFKRSKILAGVGPAVDSYEMIEQMVLSGVNGFRFNFSHGANEERVQQTVWIREAAQKAGKPVAILQDLQGPKIRLGEVTDNYYEVKTGDELELVYGATHEGATIPVQYDLSAKVKVGELVFIFDGKVRTTTLAVDAERKAIRVRVENDGVLMSRKGINLPDTDFGGDILTKKDLEDIAFGATQDYDYVALSFVQSAADIINLRDILKQHGSTARVVAKIETKAAIEDDELEMIVKASDGVMVARGDLAVEAGAEVVPTVQRRIIGLCQKYGRLSIVATQVMASMVEAPEPTRAEVSDIANAVITGADCLMLSDETAMGKYPIRAVQAMKRVILYTQEHADLAPIYNHADHHDEVCDCAGAISSSAVLLASQLGASAIVAETKSGATAIDIAAHRPELPIIAVTSDQRVAQQLCLMYATKSFVRPDGERAGLTQAKELVDANFFDKRPVEVVVVSGKQPGLIGGTDTIRVRIIE